MKSKFENLTSTTMQMSGSSTTNKKDIDFDNIMGDEELVNVSWKPPPPMMSLPSSPSSQCNSNKSNRVATTSFIAKQYGYQYEYSTSQEDDDDEDDFYYNEDDEDRFQNNSKTNPYAANNNNCTNATRNNNTNESILSRIASTISMDNPSNPNNPNNISYKIHLLGKSYHPILDYTLRREDETNLFWFSYRCDFVSIQPNNITSDAGWGCMLRSAQMLFSQALKIHYCGREYKYPKSTARKRSDAFVQDVCMWFADYPSVDTGSWYSLHNMVAAGLSKYDVLPGEWFGPGIASHVMRDLAMLHERSWKKKYGNNGDNNGNDNGGNGESDDHGNNRPSAIHMTSNEQYHTSPSYQRHKQPVMRVHVAPEGCIYRQEVEQLMTKDTTERRKNQNERDEEERPEDDNDESFEKVDYKDVPTPSSSTRKAKIDNPLLLSHPLADIQYEQSKNDQCAKKEIPWETGLLILIPLRLGLRTFNTSSYKIPLSHILSLPQSVGFVGGAPRHALYFFGCNSDGSKVYGLDPHTVQRAPKRRKLRPEEEARTNYTKKYQVQLSDEYIRSLSCPTISSMDMSRIDPSLALGFYIRDRNDFDLFCRSVTDMKSNALETREYPSLFSIADVKPDYNADLSSAMMDMMEGGGGGNSFEMDDDVDNNEDEDDFVML